MKIIILLASCFIALMSNSCSFFYVAKQGAYQAKLLAGAEPIEQALRSKSLEAKKRTKLILVSQVRDYAQKRLTLNTHKNYKNVNLSWAHTIYNISASEPLQFKSYTWWFPIIGSVPYKGYFDVNDADKELARLKNLGLDTLKRRVGGYSSLGYFSDPVWPSMLEMRDEDLVELIIHELAHSTVYINNQTAFNETFANFVGKTGARMFYVDKFGENSAEVINFDMVNKQEKEYNNFFQELYTKLDKIYTSNIADSEKLSQQQNTLQNAKNNYNKLEVSKYYTIKNWNQINNAYLLAFKTYNHDEAVFSDLFRLVNNNFSQFLHQVAKNSIGPDPFAALRQHINYIVSNQ